RPQHRPRLWPRSRPPLAPGPAPARLRPGGRAAVPGGCGGPAAMEALPLPALGRRGPPGAAEPGEPPRVSGAGPGPGPGPGRGRGRGRGGRGTAQPCPRCIAGESVSVLTFFLWHER
uniref:Uncharacterized protein n=1 Tax=Anser brachyrhynchus TaxID=132585 RepID=A0A8B9BM91_9AVES